MSNWAFIGVVVGIWYSAMASLRYTIIYYDPSIALMNLLLGFLIICVSFIYGRQCKQGYEIDAIGEHLQDLTKSRRNK